MSFLSRLDDDDDHRARQLGGKTPALDLLDEYWFFSNALVKNKANKQAGTKPPLVPRSPSTSTKASHGQGSEKRSTSRLHDASGCRRLLRRPSLPSRRVGLPKDDELVEEEEDAHAGNHQQAVEVDDDDLNWSSIYEGVLRTRLAETGGRSSALQRAPSMPVPSSAADDHEKMSATKSTPRLRHSYSTLERHCRSTTKPLQAADEQTPRSSRERRREVRSFSTNQVVRSKSVAFQDKKWKSSSDLESIEVQGFRDLGFVFDKEELRENLADVLPGLKSSGDGAVRRPYLSEAWHHVQRPALVRVQSSDARSSAAEMKDQLRMWAQAVACNVRQEC